MGIHHDYCSVCQAGECARANREKIDEELQAATGMKPLDPELRKIWDENVDDLYEE